VWLAYIAIAIAIAPSPRLPNCGAGANSNENAKESRRLRVMWVAFGAFQTPISQPTRSTTYLRRHYGP
jgi:hypothetical protein